MEINKIHCLDVIEGLKKIKDNSVDCIITDPPFNISEAGKDISRKSMSSSMFKRNSNIKKDFGKWDRMEEDEFYKFTNQWFCECSRVLKDGGWFFSFFSKERTGYFTNPVGGFFANNGFKTRTIISWHKTNPTPSFRKMNFLSSCEFIIVGSKGSSRIPNFLMQKEMHNFFETANSSAYGKTKHPTEKPEKLIEWLVKIGSKEKEVVLDCFIGSGTTAVVCKRLNRDFIGIEKDSKYIDMANKRLSQKTMQEVSADSSHK